MTSFYQLINGFSIALTPENLLFALLGSLLGTIVGILPGLGPTAGIAILIPLTAWLPPIPAIIMLAAIYYGAMYGGSTTSILVNTPGEVSSVVTALDGYQLAKQGKAGVALSISAISSFVAGTLSIVGLTFFAPPLAEAALLFGPPEYFGLMCLSLSVVIGFSEKSLLKGIAATLVGILISMIGQDPMRGEARLTFGTIQLIGGINFISVVIGLFAISEIFINIDQQEGNIFQKISRLYPTWKELKSTIGTMLRSSLGFFLGLLPGCTPGVISFLSYDIERRISKDPGKFGKGALEGVAAPEGANNAATSGGFVPLFSLGIPTTPALAVLLSGLMIYGLQPGPMLFKQNPDFIWAVIASMYIGNVMLLILNLPLVGLWTKLIDIPYKYLGPGILAFCFIGAYSLRNNIFDVWMSIVFGIVGYLMQKLDYPVAPLVLGLILGPMLEQSFRQSLAMAGGSPLILLTRPIGTTFLVLAVITIVISLYIYWRNKQK